MERVLTQEERIRRAEEIYLRRRNLQPREYKVQNREENINSVNNSNPIRVVKLFKRIFLQIVICLLLYCIFYLIYDTNFAFSDITISKTEEILNYDINIGEMYKNITTYVNGLMHNEESVENNSENIQEQQMENANEANSEEQKQEVIESQNEANVKDPTLEEEGTVEKRKVEEENQPTVAEEVSLKQLYSLIVPLKGGYISSEFGDRESTSEIVSTNHKGIDIAAATRN